MEGSPGGVPVEGVLWRITSTVSPPGCPLEGVRSKGSTAMAPWIGSLNWP